MQARAEHHTWVAIGVDGTDEWNRVYVHCAPGASGLWANTAWWPFEGRWATVYRMQSACDFDAQPRAAWPCNCPM